MLNTTAAPFNNHTLRKAMAMCVNQAQYTKVIDKGVDAPMHGLFIEGSPYYTKTAYPKYNPPSAAKLVKQVQQQTGKPSASPSTRPAIPRRWRRRSSCSRPSSRPACRCNINILAQATIINDALAGTYQATLWRQFGAVDPDLNYVWWTDDSWPRAAGPEHGPQRRPPDSDAR